MPSKPYPSETQDRFIVRLPNGMRDDIAAHAKKNGRSMNAEIVARLQETFVVGTSMSPPVIVQNFDELMNEFMRRYNIKIEPGTKAHTPEFADQDDDMPMDPPKRRVNLKRKKA